MGEVGMSAPASVSKEQLERLKRLFKDVFAAQQYLIEVKQLRKEEWDCLANYFQAKEFFEVVEERSCRHTCGFCFCDNHVMTMEERHASRYAKANGLDFEKRFTDYIVPPIPDKILKYSKKVKDFVDIKETLYYCSKNCYVEAKVLAETLDTTPINLRSIPWKSFSECLDLLRSFRNQEAGNDRDVVMTEATEGKHIQREVNKVKEELAACNVTEVAKNFKVSENIEPEQPSLVFVETSVVPQPSDRLKEMKLPLYAVTSVMLTDLVSEKTKKFLTTLEEIKNTTECEEFKYSFPSISVSNKRFETFHKAIVTELTKLQQLFGFPNSALKFISKLLGTFKYSSPIKISRDALKLMSLVFIFVASNYDKICKQKVDENIVVLKRLYRVDCGITKGQFDDLLG